ncbi:hypothetical protein EDC96DRAFT_574366 [Choanephora cucurbitarum]|nr:hypothetical protein EDC96DRAFT_574366 [Choanephora cucurbitarum]
MNLDNDIFHVVIRLPYKRPPRFVEPPPIVWTNEMEHKLWQYMSQKNTNWNEIAEQLGVPAPYVVRHAAFIYETQLRGIHQQLRLNTTTNIGNSVSRNSPTPSKSLSRPASIRHSNGFSQEPLAEVDVLSEKSKDTIHSSTDQSSTSTIRHRTVVEDTHHSEEEEEEEGLSSHFDRMKMQVEEPAFLPHKRHGSVDHDLGNSRQQLSLSIQNLRKINTLDSGSPSSLPQSPIATLQHTHKQASSSNASVSHSMGSSFSDLSDSSVTQSALEEAFLSKFNQGGSKM